MPFVSTLFEAAQSGELPWPRYWGITLAPLLGNYLGPVTGEFTLVLMACIGDIPWPSTLTDRFAELLLGYRLADTRVQYPK
jgi:hypothetical protein